MTISLFALLIAELCLHELCACVGMVADFLVGVGVFESLSTNALGMHLVGDSVFGVAWIEGVSLLLARWSSIDIRHTSGSSDAG